MGKNKISDSYTVADLFENILNNDILLNKAGKNSKLINLMKEIIDKNVLIVKPNLTLNERIEAGNYDWKNNSINESNFPHDTTTVGEWEFELIHPNKSISSKYAKALCEENGWQAAKLEHLLSFREAFPEEYKKYPIVELGSVCRLDDGRNVARLFRRNLDLVRWLGVWDSNYYFLSVRKVSGS